MLLIYSCIFSQSNLSLFHRVGCNLAVAIPFIAVSTARSLALLALLYMVAVFTVFYLHYNLLLFKIMKCSRKDCCKNICLPLCQMLLAFILFVSLLAVLSALTLFFNSLAKHGLASSGLEPGQVDAKGRHTL